IAVRKVGRLSVVSRLEIVLQRLAGAATYVEGAKRREELLDGFFGLALCEALELIVRYRDAGVGCVPVGRENVCVVESFEHASGVYPTEIEVPPRDVGRSKDVLTHVPCGVRRNRRASSVVGKARVVVGS